MKILIIGSGGREHALAWKIAQSPRVSNIFCAPGNAGTAEVGENISIKADDLPELLSFAKRENVDLTCVGPEVALVLGITDLFINNGLKIFGPSKTAALLEGSKIYAKHIMKKYDVPTADFEVFDDAKKALEYIQSRKLPIVVKADGLAAGKGVSICRTFEEAKTAIQNSIIKCAFGEAGKRILIEDCLEGEEASILVITDGKNVTPLASSQDHKRIFDGDKGLNTGGMGAYSPAPVITETLFDKIMKEVIYPVIRGMKKEGNPYKGVLYAGIMLTNKGPKVLEFNVRFGDPETQAIVPRMKTDLVDLMECSISDNLQEKSIKWDKKVCVSVVLASGGYPGSYEKEKTIKGLKYFKGKKDAFIFHAGTKRDNNNIITNGGRVLNVVGLGGTIKRAIEKAYEGVSKISFEGMHYRKDIGQKALNKTIKL